MALSYDDSTINILMLIIIIIIDMSDMINLMLLDYQEGSVSWRLRNRPAVSDISDSRCVTSVNS